MPIIVQKFFTREDVRANRDRIYVYGDNDARKGTGGQAKACRGEPNTYGIRTKKAPDRAPEVYYYDSEFEQNITKIGADFRELEAMLHDGITAVFPEDGFGTGLALLKDNAPETLAYIEEWVALLMERYG
jgi:hypothetical protein